MLHKLISIIILSSLLLPSITLNLGLWSTGNGTYEEGEFYDDANENGIWDEGETVYDDWVEVNMFNEGGAIRGFQFDIYGIELVGGSGGLAADNGFDIYASGNTVLGFSLTGNTIPAGDGGLLTTIYGNLYDANVCLPFVQNQGPEEDTPIFADEEGTAYSDVSIDEGFECDALSNYEEYTFNLFQAYPNPFNPELNIDVNIEENNYTNILVYNINGQLIQTIYSGMLTGNVMHHFTWDATNYSSGIYIIKVDSDSFTQSRIVNLLK